MCSEGSLCICCPGASLRWDHNLVIRRILCWEPSLRVCLGQYKVASMRSWITNRWSASFVEVIHDQRDPLFRDANVAVKLTKYIQMTIFYSPVLYFKRVGFFLKVMTILISDTVICEWKVSNLLFFWLKHHMNMCIKAKMNLSEWGNEFFNRC